MGLSTKYLDRLEYISLGIQLFNKISLYKDKLKNNKILGKITISKENSLYKDYYVRIISHTLSKTSWYDLFHLNFIDTLNLEYSTWDYLKKILDDYEKALNEEKEATENKLDKNFKS